MQKIIVPVDFSATAANAAEFAGNLAIFYGAEVWLYHTFELPVSIGEFTYPLFDIAEMQKAAEHEIEILRDQLLKKLRSNVTVHIKAEMTVLKDGLAELCNELKPDLVVMGLSGSNALTKLVVGSNTIKVVHELTYPVLVVPPKASFSPVLKIGLACDYLQIEETTPVALIKKIVTDFNANLYILNVDNNSRHFTDDMVQESFGIKEMFKEVNPVYESIVSENVTTGINQFAANAGLDWIVVIPKKHTILQKIFSRSHSTDLLYHTSVPILCIHQ